MTTTTKQAQIAEYQAFLNGLQKNAPNATMILGNQSYTSAQLVQTLESVIASGTSVLTAKSAWHDAVQSDLKIEAQFAPLFRDLRATVGAMFSTTETTLAEFGMTPRKAPTPMSAEILVLRAAKAKATRAARGTKGAKQKAAIKGNVISVTMVPVTTDASAPATSGQGGTVPGSSTPSATT